MLKLNLFPYTYYNLVNLNCLDCTGYRFGDIEDFSCVESILIEATQDGPNGGTVEYNYDFTTDEVEGDNTRVSVSYKGLPRDLEIGDKILLNNGLMTFLVKNITDSDIVCETVVGGEL